MRPWTDRTGRFSALRSVVFIGVLTPALWIAAEAMLGGLGERPVTEAIHQTGLWAIRLLAISLAVTPLREALRWPKLASVRRMLGLAVLAYALLHFGLYILNQHFDVAHIASEIALRFYLALGFIALCGFCVLGVTSTDTMIARLGSARWNRLHRFIYVGAVLATVHFFLQSKLDVSQAILMAGIFSLLAAYRIAKGRLGDLTASQLAGLAIFLTFSTAFGEALWYAWSVGAPLILVLGANFDFSYRVRPCWYALGAGLILWAARLLRPWIERTKFPPDARITAPQVQARSV
ncbi:sulfoxide reductase heme-binding subunit YedZ [Beijerinckiaceae bacterium]|nr:sulfoxide reductase heme-binding subunit YedZ [Beijerinckiaceae bacterium]